MRFRLLRTWALRDRPQKKIKLLSRKDTCVTAGAALASSGPASHTACSENSLDALRVTWDITDDPHPRIAATPWTDAEWARSSSLPCPCACGCFCDATCRVQAVVFPEVALLELRIKVSPHLSEAITGIMQNGLPVSKAGHSKV
jgi:hypothetical protein